MNKRLLMGGEGVTLRSLADRSDGDRFHLSVASKGHHTSGVITVPRMRKSKGRSSASFVKIATCPE